MSVIQIYKTSIPYEPTFIYPNVSENQVRLYNLFKTNCKDCVKDNNDRVVIEMQLIRDFVDTNNIQFPLSTEKSIIVAAGGPIFCFVVLLKSFMTVVKSVSDGLRD